MRDLLVEQILNSNDEIAWEYRENVPLSQVDEKRSLTNQARVGLPLNESLVQQYARSRKEGSDFPAIVAYEDGNKLINIDGNHRYASALKAKKMTHDFYIVLTNDPLQRQVLTFELNTYNGVPQSDADRAAQVVTLQRLGLDIPQIMTRMHLARTQVTDALNEHEGRVRAQSLGVKMAWDKIEARTSRVRLQGLKLDKVFTLAVQYCSRFQLSGARVAEFVRNVRDLPSEDSQLSYIRNEISAAEEKAKHRKGRFREIVPAFDAVLSHLMKIDGEEAVRSMTMEEKLRAKEKLSSAIEQMQKTLSLLV